MSETTNAVDKIIQFVVGAVTEKIKNVPRDRTVFSKIAQSLEDGRYKVEYAGKTYSAFSVNGETYSAGDTVVITFMEGTYENIVIIGKNQ